ncbi:MAG: hypothetical protein J0M33_03760 [Anaerolineae bacterium]|nr:hypothetical protein [Anaerolineae bacterium]
METGADFISILLGEGWLILNGHRAISPYPLLGVVVVSATVIASLYQGHRENRLKAEATAKARREAIEESISRIVSERDPAFSPFNIVVPLLTLLIISYFVITLLSAAWGS